MKKIRINELARELEVKAHEILDRLPELGVTEKKTHSSSIDEDVAIKLRRYYGFDVPEDAGEASEEAGPAEESSAATTPAPVPEAAAPEPAAPVETAPAPKTEENRTAAPIRPPLAEAGRFIRPSGLHAPPWPLLRRSL